MRYMQLYTHNFNAKFKIFYEKGFGKPKRGSYIYGIKLKIEK